MIIDAVMIDAVVDELLDTLFVDCFRCVRIMGDCMDVVMANCIWVCGNVKND